MTKAELASMIDAYADAKASGNKYLVQKMIEELEQALTEVCDSVDMPPVEIPRPPQNIPPFNPPAPPAPSEEEAVGSEY